MHMTRVFTDQALAAGTSITLDARAAHHVATVLRLRTHAPLVLFNGRGGEFTATITAAAPHRVDAAVVEYREVSRESPFATTLVQALARADRMAYTIQKAVELGVTRIIPVVSTRSVVRLDAERAARKTDHWQGIAIAAAEQSGRTRVPLIEQPEPLRDWLQAAPPANGIYLQPGAATTLAGGRIEGDAGTLFTGPEGGFTPEEIELLDRAGCRAMSLGPRILRAETAALVALSVLQARYGDFP